MGLQRGLEGNGLLCLGLVFGLVPVCNDEAEADADADADADAEAEADAEPLAVVAVVVVKVPDADVVDASEAVNVSRLVA